MSENNAHLRSIVQRAVNLTNERKALADDLKDLLQEAKSQGFDPKAIRAVVKRQIETDDARVKRETVESDVDLILAALGNYAELPLGQAALERAA